MKKLIILPILMVVVATISFASADEVDVFAFLYQNARTNSAQLDILQHMAEARLTGAGEFYAQALRRLVSEYSNIRDVTERNAADEQAVILSALLGAERYTPAAADLWLVVDGFQAPLVRAEAIMALGRIQARAYLPQVIRVLESLNTAPTADRLSGERVAFGTIIALEKYQDSSGYLPVFFASEGWYSRRITDQARRSLPLIARDPTPFMLEIVRGPGYNIPLKFTALRTIEGAEGVSNRNKASIAVAALNEGWRTNPSDVQLRNMLAEMRLLAIDMITRYGSEEMVIYDLLERSYTDRNSTMTEKLSAVRAIAAQRTDESARRLSRFLTNLNNRRRTGVTTREDEQLVRAIIPALGHAGRPLGRPALTEVSGSNWTNAVINLANQALRDIGN